VDGTIYFAEQVTAHVWRVTPDGVLSRAAGGDGGCYYSSNPDSSCGEGAPATQASLLTPVGASIDPAGRLLVAEHDGLVVRRFRSTLPGFTGNSMLVAAGDPGELYEFDQSGRHLRTINGFTGATRFAFSYNSAGLLAGITDGDGASTTIERTTDGSPTAIVGPDAHRTTLAVDPGGFLQRIEDPAGHAWTATYGSGGLVTKITDPNTHASEYTYGALGRLTGTLDAEGGTKTPARTDQSSGYTVGVTSGLGVSRSYSYEPMAGGAFKRVSTDGAGLATTSVYASDATTTTTTPDGTTITTQQRPDPRFGMQARLRSRSIQLPSGLTATVETGRRTILANASDPLSMVSQVDSTILNGRVYRTTWTAASRSITTQSPEGRTVTHRVDSQGRLTEVDVPGFTPITYEYDARGRLSRVAQGPRNSRLTYDESGRLATWSDFASRTTRYFYDADDRLVRQVLPGNRSLLFSYDPRGNITGVTPPGRPEHVLDFNRVNLTTGYIPAGLGPAAKTTYIYNSDRNPTHITKPDGSAVVITYDAAGRPETVNTPTGQSRATYSATTGELSSLTAPSGATLHFSYDGSFQREVAWAGVVSGTVGVTYNADAQLAGQSVNGDNDVTFSYDDDGLLTQAGALTLSRNSSSGLPTSSAVGVVNTTNSYNDFGEVSALEVNAGSTGIFHAGYTRDNLGRITQNNETVQGVTTNLAYTYDAAGRLSEVRRNGAVVANYGYDENGNRTTVSGPGISVTGTYDAQDRLESYGTTSYTYTPSGDLRTKSDATGTTTYTYDVFGNLTTVALPSGSAIEYITDGQNRRIGKKVGGVLQRAWLYQGQFNPVAELDGAGHVVSRFVYATNGQVPAYMLRDGATYRFATDQLGSVRLVINTADGSVAQRLDYDEFGRIIANTNPGFQPFGYAGGLLDEETGLVRFGARDYDPLTGRWTSRDPIGLVAGTNAYEYVEGDPINGVDPTGYCASSQDCGPVPVGPPGVDVDANIKEARKHVSPWWFRDQVKDKGPWDYKRKGKQGEYEAFGNFNYGATGAAMGIFSDRTLLREAGRNQIEKGNSKPEWGEPGSRLNPWGGTPPFGDDPEDQKWIKKGIEYLKCKDAQ
jgi:RHS repeat-associated protein